MQIEFRDLDVDRDAAIAPEILQAAIGPALHRFEERIRLVRVRFLPDGGHETTCRVRVWCGKGSTVVVEEHAGSKIEAIHAAAHTLKRSLHGRWRRQRSRLRHAGLLP